MDIYSEREIHSGVTTSHGVSRIGPQAADQDDRPASRAERRPELRASGDGHFRPYAPATTKRLERCPPRSGGDPQTQGHAPGPRRLPRGLEREDLSAPLAPLDDELAARPHAQAPSARHLDHHAPAEPLALLGSGEGQPTGAPSRAARRLSHGRRQPQHDRRPGQLNRDPLRVSPTAPLGVRFDRIEALGQRERLAEHHVELIGCREEVATCEPVPDAHLTPQHERERAVR